MPVAQMNTLKEETTLKIIESTNYGSSINWKNPHPLLNKINYVLANIKSTISSSISSVSRQSNEQVSTRILGAIFHSSKFKLDLRTHLMSVHHQISSDIYLVNLGIKSDIESSEGIWCSSNIYLTLFWRIKDSTRIGIN